MAYLPTLDDLIQDLQLAKEIAIKNENVNGVVNAVMAQAKLLGIDGKQTGSNDSSSPVFNIMGVSPDNKIAVIRTIVDPVNNTVTSYSR